MRVCKCMYSSHLCVVVYITQYAIFRRGIYNSEFAICPIARHGNANSIQNLSTVTNTTMELYCILLPLTLPCCTTWQIANSLMTKDRQTRDNLSVLLRISMECLKASQLDAFCHRQKYFHYGLDKYTI